MELGLGGVLRFHTDHRGFNVVRGSLNSRRCHHGLHRFPTSVGDSFIIPLFIVGFPGEGAVIILTGRGDLGHGEGSQLRMNESRAGTGVGGVIVWVRLMFCGAGRRCRMRGIEMVMQSMIAVISLIAWQASLFAIWKRQPSGSLRCGRRPTVGRWNRRR